MKQERGKFIVVEGIDGSGKSTLVNRLVDTMNEVLSIPTIGTSEPTSGPIGKMIREYLRGEKELRDEYSLQPLYMADRLEHLAEIQKILDDGTSVVCDRFFMSSVAYGCYPDIDKFYEEWKDDKIGEYDYKDLVLDRIVDEINLHEGVLANTFVSEYYTNILYLMTSLSNAIGRINGRNDDHEMFDDECKLRAISTGYKQMMKLMSEAETEFPYDVYEINGNNSEDGVFNDALEVIKKLYNIKEE